MMAHKAKKQNQEPKIRLNQCHLYGLKSPHALALRLGVSLSKLERLASANKYSVFTLKTGRVVQEPEAGLQVLHRKIHRYLARVGTPEYLHSTVRGSSYVSNAATHLGTTDTVKIDVKKFFPSVPQYRIMHFFRDTLKCSGDVAGLLANLICFNGFLATGSSASPIVSFYAFHEMFEEMHTYATTNGFVLSVYVDDVTMSGPNLGWTDLQQLHRIIKRFGLQGHKTKISKGNKPRLVTGVMIAGHEAQLPFSRWQKIKQLSKAASEEPDNQKKMDVLTRLVSTLYEAAQIEPKCRRMAEHFHRQLRTLKGSQVAAKAASS
jgi:RNA-directed DNA polymerase